MWGQARQGERDMSVVDRVERLRRAGVDEATLTAMFPRAGAGPRNRADEEECLGCGRCASSFDYLCGDCSTKKIRTPRQFWQGVREKNRFHLFGETGPIVGPDWTREVDSMEVSKAKAPTKD